MNPIPILKRESGHYLNAGIRFVNRHQAALFTTNHLIQWHAHGATGAVALFHTIEIPAFSVPKVYLSTLPFGNGRGYPILERGVATAIFLIRAGGFYGVSVKRVPHGKKPTGLVLTIQNLLVKSAAAGPSTLIVPELPTGSRNTPDAWLIEICSRLRGGSIDRIVFKGGGTFKIPQWFILLCGQLGIIVEILEPLAFDRRFPSDPIMDNTAFSVCNL